MKIRLIIGTILIVLSSGAICYPKELLLIPRDKITYDLLERSNKKFNFDKRQIAPLMGQAFGITANRENCILLSSRMLTEKNILITEGVDTRTGITFVTDSLAVSNSGEMRREHWFIDFLVGLQNALRSYKPGGRKGVLFSEVGMPRADWDEAVQILKKRLIESPHIAVIEKEYRKDIISIFDYFVSRGFDPRNIQAGTRMWPADLILKITYEKSSIGAAWTETSEGKCIDRMVVTSVADIDKIVKKTEQVLK